MPTYRARIEVGGSNRMGTGGDSDVEFMKHLESPSEVAKLEQRWTGSWADSPRAL